MGTSKNVNNNILSLNESLDYFDQNFEFISNSYFSSMISENEENIIREKANEIIQRYSIIEGISYNHAVFGICSLFQSGAHMKSILNRTTIIQNVEFTKKTLLFASEQVGNKYTLRAIARSMRNTIVLVSYKYDIPGHLYRKFRLENSDECVLSTEEDLKIYSVYCTDFNSDNPFAPLIIRKFLSKREKLK